MAKIPKHQVGEAPDLSIAKMNELIRKRQEASPCPVGGHSVVMFRVALMLGSRFSRGATPGGWLFALDHEFRFQQEGYAGTEYFDTVVPDVAAWRHQTKPYADDKSFETTAPEWVCEILSPSTERHDRGYKLRLYAANKVKHIWLIDHRRRKIEVFDTLDYNWLAGQTIVGDGVHHLEPFEAVEFDMAQLWRDLDPGSRANEPPASYRR